MTRDREFFRTIFRIALPSAFQGMISFLVVIADNIMVASLPNGVFAQAAVAQVNSITAFFTATTLGLVSGSTVLISQYWGRKDIDRIRKIFCVVVFFCVSVSLVFVAAALIIPHTVIGLVVGAKEAEAVRLANEYWPIVCFSYIPFAVSAALIGMLRSVEIVRITLYTAILALFTNIGFNYVLIFGKLGFPAMGVPGAALATVISRVIELAAVWFYAFRVQKRLTIRPRDLLHTEKWLVMDYIHYGLPVGITDMQWSLIGMLKAAVIGQMGAVFMAANSIANSMAELGTLFVYALAGGACVVVGKEVGKGNYARVREYSKTLQVMFLLIGLLMAAVVFLLRRPFTLLFGSAADPEVFRLSVLMIGILAVTLIGTCYHASCFIGINRGAGDSRFVALVDMICGWLIVLPSTLLAAFVFKAPLPVIFLCTRIDQTFKWIIAFLRLRGNKWIRNVTRK